MSELFTSYTRNLFEKSKRVAAFFASRMQTVTMCWLGIMVPLLLLKLAIPRAPFLSFTDFLLPAAWFAAILIAPIAGYMIAKKAFEEPLTRTQPQLRLAVFGNWRAVEPANLSGMPGYGPVGFMASLLVGMMLNVVFRTGEFLLAVPVMGSNAPAWGSAMFNLMAFDVVVTSFFYMAAFAMALRTIPLFPRMLAYAWTVDIAMQLLIARELAAIGGIPPMVVEPLVNLLNGNVDKVLISIAIWLPYLLLSERVNVTYRHRLPA